MFTKVLIANRGEVALRINSTLERLGISAVGIYTHRDRNALHVQRIDECVLLPDGEQTGYLAGEQIIAAAKAHGAEAIHPGYGFLAENAGFAKACEKAGLTFIGPPPSAIVAMGDKISARAHSMRVGVPVVPGISSPGLTDDELIDACADLKFPLLVKPAAGGGGKGLHVAHDIGELREALPGAHREAKAAFADDTLFVEQFILRARHIEIQVAADNFGASMHLGERECSLQRRHQKVIEEAPSPVLSAEQRKVMGTAALKIVSAIDYRNLGTIEFLVDAQSPDSFYFMEMNTRLQVEHRVTEMTSGLDLVECQLRLASGEALKAVIPSFQLSGHAIEARVYAEDPAEHFLPTGGFIGKFTAADLPHAITDSSVGDGVFVSTSFDPMLAKIACWAGDRPAAIERLRKALAQTVLLGITTNIDFLTGLLASSQVHRADYDTASLEQLEIERATPPASVLDAYASIATVNSSRNPWHADGWRLLGMPRATVTGYIDGIRYDVPIPAEPFSITARSNVDYFSDDSECWIHHPSFGTWRIKRINDRHGTNSERSDQIVSPMPGVVIAVNVTNGDQVSVGDPLVVIEAMKMEHIVRATHAGRVVGCHATFGANVRAGQLLIEVAENV